VDSFNTPGRGYGDGNDNDTAGWYEIDLSPIQPPGEEMPFRLFVNRFESSSPDSEQFIHDPRKRLAEAIEEFSEDWKVTTFVVNHHRTLSVKHVYVMATSSESEKTVGLTIYKKNGL
jgi:hypothetical protein